MPDTALVIVARYPQAGTTKTRLARAIGDEATVRLYRAFLTDLAHRFAGNALYDLYWAYTPGEIDYAAFLATLAPSLAHSMRCFPQQGDEFGMCLLNAFRWTYERGYKRTILIGSDSPHIGADVIARAWDALDEADVALGPADDGGYYLIAMHQPHDVFQDIPMSTSQVLQLTIDLARRQGLRVSTLDTLFDVDEESDLARLAQLLRANASLAPVTATHLATIKEFV